jgi:hypothetical protein
MLLLCIIVSDVIGRNQESIHTVIQQLVDGVTSLCHGTVTVFYSLVHPVTGEISHWK